MRAIVTSVLFGLTCVAYCGDLSGRIVVNRVLSKKAVPVVYNLRGTAPAAPAASGDAINEFDRVVVWLEGGPGKSKAPVSTSINQKGTAFEPDIVVVPVGSSIDFPNSDPIFHNVFSLSKAQPFDLGYYRRGQSRTVKFNRAGVVQVYCHIHSQMYAAIVVTSSPWFAKPASDGTFSFNDLPAGHYRVMSWHKAAGFYHSEVDIPEHGRAEATVRIPIDAEQRP
jgi:plastocyanin